MSCIERLDNACGDGNCVSQQGLEQGNRCWFWAASGDTATSPPWPPVGGDGVILKEALLGATRGCWIIFCLAGTRKQLCSCVPQSSITHFDVLYPPAPQLMCRTQTAGDCILFYFFSLYLLTSPLECDRWEAQNYQVS